MGNTWNRSLLRNHSLPHNEKSLGCSLLPHLARFSDLNYLRTGIGSLPKIVSRVVVLRAVLYFLHRPTIPCAYHQAFWRCRVFDRDDVGLVLIWNHSLHSGNRQSIYINVDVISTELWPRISIWQALFCLGVNNRNQDSTVAFKTLHPYGGIIFKNMFAQKWGGTPTH